MATIRFLVPYAFLELCHSLTKRCGLFPLPLKLSRTLPLPWQREYRKRCCVTSESRLKKKKKRRQFSRCWFPSLSLAMSLGSLLPFCKKSCYPEATKLARSHRVTRDRDAQRNLQIIPVSSLQIFQLGPTHYGAETNQPTTHWKYFWPTESLKIINDVLC